MERLRIHTDKSPELSEVATELKAKLGHALSTGPSDSNMCCCLAKEGDQFVLNLRVHSLHGHFPLHLENRDSKTLVEDAFKRIRKQFQSWHENPKKYGDDHAIGTQACTHVNGEVLKCPIGSPANKHFEKFSS